MQPATYGVYKNQLLSNNNDADRVEKFQSNILPNRLDDGAHKNIKKKKMSRVCINLKKKFCKSRMTE